MSSRLHRLRSLPTAEDAVGGVRFLVGVWRTLRRETPTDAVMSEVWREGGYVTVERRAPAISETGKVLHVLSSERAAAAEGRG
ncbi:MAG: hypothetical protein EXR58_01865 [Chloroflexi bacterium]|nr:hypothetical protein [Chloroflexota bacterium]